MTKLSAAILLALLLALGSAWGQETTDSNGSQESDPERSYLLTPYRPNYILPIAWTSDTGNINQANIDPAFQLDNLEFHFQLSVKFPIRQEFIFQDSPLWFGYTVRSFWQAYNTDVSRPFRETNHEPELFWEIPSTINVGPFHNRSNALILNHQSNGQSGSLSRSWNRVMVASRWQVGDLQMEIKPWIKLPHEIGPDADFAEDNPDITEYLGYFDWLTVYERDGHQVTVNLRNNLRSENRGSVEIHWAFPLHRTFKGLITYFNGYGESMIDYNHSQERLSIGIQVSDWY